jgi:hypothetical protein
MIHKFISYYFENPMHILSSLILLNYTICWQEKFLFDYNRTILKGAVITQAALLLKSGPQTHFYKELIIKTRS